MAISSMLLNGSNSFKILHGAVDVVIMLLDRDIISAADCNLEQGFPLV